MVLEKIMSWLDHHLEAFSPWIAHPAARGKQMSRTSRRLPLLLSAALLALTWAPAPSFAVVEGIENSNEFSDPNSPYSGMNWSYNYQTMGGTSVAIGYFTLLTASHYYINTVDDDDPGYSTFVINGDTWRVAGVENLAADPGQTFKPDVRVLHMENLTNPYRALPGFYDLYTYDGAWPADERSFVIVGTGDTGSTASPHYYTDTPGTRELRWGTNRYETLKRRYETGYDETRYSTLTFEMCYSKVLSPTPHESGLGDGDSGGGVFVKDGDTWKLAGIGLYRDPYMSGYRNFYAASIPYCADRLYDILQYDLLPGDVNLDGNVDSDDYVVLKGNFGTTGGATWYDGDFDGDGNVNFEDLYALETNFEYTSNPHPDMTIPDVWASSGGSLLPEPATLLLLGAGAMALTIRRGKRRASR